MTKANKKKIRVAVVCACGWLNSHGYQWMAPIAVASFCEFADKTILIQSTRRSGLAEMELLANHRNLEIIADERTYFSKREDESTVDDSHFHDRNLFLGLQIAKDQGFDAILWMHSGWYIPRRNMAALRALAEQMVAQGKTFETIYRASQVGPVLFHSNYKVDYLLNRSWEPDGRDDPYRLQQPDTKRRYCGAGDDTLAVVDCPCEMTHADLTPLFSFNSANQATEQDIQNWMAIMTSRYERKYRIDDQTLVDVYTAKVSAMARQNRDFVSWEILRRLRLA